MRPASLSVANRSAPPPKPIGGPSSALSARMASTMSPPSDLGVRRREWAAARDDVLRGRPPQLGVLAFDVGDGRVGEVELVPVGHDVVHDPAHDLPPDVAQQLIGEPVLVFGRVVVVEAAVGVGVHAVGGEDDVELECVACDQPAVEGAAADRSALIRPARRVPGGGRRRPSRHPCAATRPRGDRQAMSAEPVDAPEVPEDERVARPWSPRSPLRSGRGTTTRTRPRSGRGRRSRPSRAAGPRPNRCAARSASPRSSASRA